MKACYSTLLGSDCLTSDLAAGRFIEVMLWFNLCLSVIVSLSISGHVKIDLSLLFGPRCGLFPVIFSDDHPLLELVFIFEVTARM